MTAVGDFTLRQGGPALLFENPVGYTIPVLANLFGTTARVAKAMGATEVSGLRDIGVVLANLKEPEPPEGPARRRSPVTNGEDAVDDAAGHGVPAAVPRGRGRRLDEIDLGRLPVQTCWPDDAGPLITWGLVVTRGPQGAAGLAPAPEPGHLSPAGDRPAPGDHALAGPSRRRARLPRVRRGPPGPALSDRGGARRRPGDDARRRHAGARHALGVPVRRPAARQPDRGDRLRGRRCRRLPAGAGERRVRLRGPHPGRRARLRGTERARRARRARSAATCTRSRARSATTPAITTSPTGSRCSRSSG